MIHYLISHLERSTLNLNIRVGEWFSHQSAKLKREIYWIKELGTYGSNGYNASKGGDGTILYNHSEIVELARLGYTSFFRYKKK